MAGAACGLDTLRRIAAGETLTSLITGAAGLVGSHLTALVVERGETPRVLLRRGERVEGIAEDRIDVRYGDMRDRGSLEAAVEGIDCIFHCAAKTGPWGDEGDYESVNVRGLETLIEAALAARVRRIVHLSSITVHGNDVRGAADENSPLRTEPNPYSRSKVAGEHLVQRMIREHGAPITVVRPGWIYGPRDRSSFGRFAAMIERGRMILIGSGTNHLPLVHVTDVAEGVWLAGRSDQAEGRVYLLVNDEPVTQREYLATMAAELGAAPPRLSIPYVAATTLAAIAESAARVAHRREPPPLMRYGIQLLGGENVFRVDRARRELGFVPRVRLSEGVRRTVEWYRTQAPAVTTSREAA